MLEKVITGIEGLDKMLFGGIPQGNQVILAGGPGAGKTLLGMEFLCRNAEQGINSVMFSLEESRGQLMRNVKEAFSDFTDVDQLLDSGKLSVYDVEMMGQKMDEVVTATHTESRKEGYMDLTTGRREITLNDFFKGLEGNLPELLKKSQAKIAVIDSLTVVKNLFHDDYEYRNFVMDMTRILKAQGITSILITELADPRENRVRFGPEFFVFDGIITMYYSLGAGKKVPLIEIIKMRGTDHSYKAVPYKITSSGIKTLNVGME